MLIAISFKQENVYGLYQDNNPTGTRLTLKRTLNNYHFKWCYAPFFSLRFLMFLSVHSFKFYFISIEEFTFIMPSFINSCCENVSLSVHIYLSLFVSISLGSYLSISISISLGSYLSISVYICLTRSISIHLTRFIAIDTHIYLTQFISMFISVSLGSYLCLYLSH